MDGNGDFVHPNRKFAQTPASPYIGEPWTSGWRGLCDLPTPSSIQCADAEEPDTLFKFNLKGDIRVKIRKRVLSAVLAATMLVTSLGTGLAVMAEEVNADPYRTLADALKSEDLKTVTWSQEGSNPTGITVIASDNASTPDVDETVAVRAAAEAFWDVVQIEAPNYDGEVASPDWYANANNAKLMVNAILERLQNEDMITADERPQANLVLDYFVGVYPADGNRIAKTGSEPDLAEGNYKFRVAQDLNSILLKMDPDVSKLPDSIKTQIEYSYSYGVQLWRSGFLNVNRNKRQYLKENGWSVAETGANTAIPAALKAFDAYFTDELLGADLSALTGEELEQRYTDAMAQVNALSALNLWGNDEVMNHFFDKEAIEAYINNVEAAIDVAYARDYVAELQTLMANDPATMEHDALNTLYSDLTALRASLEDLNGDAVNTAFTEVGLTWDAVNAYIASVNEEIEVDNLEGYKAVIDEIVISLPEDLTTIEDGTALQADYAQLTTQMALINECTADAIARVFTDGTEYVTAAIDRLNVELQRRQLINESLEFGAYFEPKMDDDLTTIDTNTLINDYRTPDRAKFEEVQKFEPEALDLVYGEGWYASVEAYIASIDATLTARVEAQIDEAVSNYQEFGQITILNYKEFKAAFDGIEMQILDVITLSEDYQAKYDSLTPMLDQYTEFVNSKGLSSWQEGPVEYPVRESMPGDMARTAEETYSVDADKLNTVINSLDGLMQNPEVGNLLASLGVTGIDGAISDLIKGAISDNLYTDQMVNTLMTTIYGLLVDAINGVDLGSIGGLLDLIGGIDGLLGDLEIAIYPSDLAEFIHPEEFPEVAAALRAAGDNWDNYDVTATWHVTDKESFVHAASMALSGLQTALWPILTNQTYSGNAGPLDIASVNIPGVGLYGNDILPLLKLLGCENLMSAEEYNQLRWAYELLPPILNPLLDFVETLADAPVSTLLDVLPKLAYLMEFDLITTHLQNINIYVNAKASIFWDDEILSMALGTNNLYEILMSDTLGLNLDPAIFSDVNELIKMVLGMVAPDANLVLPTIDQAYLASLGTLAKDGDGYLTYATDKPAVLLAVLRYVLGMVGDQDFMDALFALIGQMTGSEIVLSDDIMTILEGIGGNPDGVICALTELFVPQEYAAQKYNYKYAPASVDEEGNPLPINTVEYSENWTKDEAQYIADNLDEFVDNMMTILGGADMPGLGDMIRSYIADEFYTNEMINTLVITIRDAINSIGIDLSPILALVDVDLSSWNDVTESTNWGVVPGDSVTFASGLSQALSPLTPLLSFLLTGQDISVLGTITANGYNGYQNGIVPLLENLGCNTAYIHTYEEYVARVNQDPSRALNDILTPILNLVDRIYQNPIDTIIDILPNLLYFIDCGGLQVAVENTLQSAFVLLDTVRPIYNISFDLNLNLQQIIVDLLANLEVNGQKLNLKIPFLNDLSLLMVGTVTEYDSKSGLDPTYMLMNTDKADFVTVLLRNVVDLIFYEENQKVITDLIANQAGLDQETADSLLEIFNTFATMYKEDNGVDKILHAAYVIFQASHETSDGALTEIKDFNERWNAVFEALEESGGFLADFANWADSVLDFLSFGLITGDGIGTSGLIDFFDRVAAFFQGRVTDVSIDRTSADMLVGQQTTLSLSFKPVTVKNKNAVWTSSNESAATVENGVVTAVGVGDTEIKATTEDGGFVVSCVVRVRADKTALNEAIALVESANLQGEQLAAVAGLLENAKAVVADELASQPSVEAAREALLAAFYALDLGEKVTDVTITQNGAPVGEVVYQKVPWTKRWNTVPVTLGVQINGGALSLDDVKSVTWQYASWSIDKPEADIEANGMEATIRAKNSVVGAHSCWIQVTVEDAYGNTVTSNPVKVRFYNYDWQK